MGLSTTDNSLTSIRLTWSVGGSLAVLFTLAAWWMMLGHPALSAREELKRQLGRIESLRAAEQAIRARLARVTVDAQAWQCEEESRRNRVAGQHDEANFLQWVNQEAQTSDWTLRDFRPAGREVQGEYEGRGVMLSSQGSYEGICRFLDRLRAYPRANRITSLELTPRDPNKTSYACTLHVMLFSQSRSETPAGNGG